MLPKETEDGFKALLLSKKGLNANINSITPLGGGSINNAFKVKTQEGDYFLKYNYASKYPGMFESEAKGLELLRKSDAIFIPEIIGHLTTEKYSFLVFEYVKEAGRKPDFWEDFGRRLARLHQNQNNSFGLDHDNYIGSLHQYNQWENSWQEFFVLQRLEPQMRMATDKGMVRTDLRKKFEAFFKAIPEIFPSEEACLIHGDLWNGNYLVNTLGEACLIDPAVYYGHREMDLGMSKLFGGFSEGFYHAYTAHFPLEKDWEKRIDYCNLYPLLVHVNLFGAGYLSSVESSLRKF